MAHIQCKLRVKKTEISATIVVPEGLLGKDLLTLVTDFYTLAIIYARLPVYIGVHALLISTNYKCDSQRRGTTAVCMRRILSHSGFILSDV